MPDALMGPAARILLRYLASMLITAGVLHDPSTLLDPDMVQVATVLLGLLSAALSEGWYALARRHGWDK